MVIAPAILSAGEVARLTRYSGEKITGISAGNSFVVELVKVAGVPENRAVVEIESILEPYLKLEIDGNGVVKIGLENLSQSLQRSLNRSTVRKITIYLNELNYIALSGAASLRVPAAGQTFH